MGMVAPNRMSVEEFMELPESKLVHELIDGVLHVNPPPILQHERAHTELKVYLYSAIGNRVDLDVLGPYSALRFGPATILSPDIFVIQIDSANPVTDWEDVQIPLLVVEILSPSTSRRDRITKRDFYQRAGVEEYWIIDIDRRRIERWRPGSEQAEVFEGRMSFALSGGLSGEIDLDWILKRVNR